MGIGWKMYPFHANLKLMNRDEHAAFKTLQRALSQSFVMLNYIVQVLGRTIDSKQIYCKLNKEKLTCFFIHTN